MSRSRRKTPIWGYTTADTDKPWKQQAARRERRAVNITLGKALDGDALSVKRYALTDPSSSMKDGKHWVGDACAEWMRK